MSRPQGDRRAHQRGQRVRPEPLRAGVIGAGNMGRHHARAYASLGGLCQLHGVFDPDAGKARAIADSYETRVYPSLEALLEVVDVVSIASPSRFHVEHALTALDAGVHMLVEKPLGLDAVEARIIAEAAAQRPELVVAVGHVEHFNPAIGELRKLLVDDTVVAIDIHRLSPYDGRITDADVVQDLMLHDIDVVLSLAAAPLSHVQSIGRPVRSELASDYAVAHLLFADGMIASLAASRITDEKIRRLTVTTTSAHVTMDYMNRTIERCRWARLDSAADGRSYRQESVVERIFVPHEEPLLAELRSFMESVRDGRPAEVGVERGIRCLEVVDLVRRSGRIEELAADPVAAPWAVQAT